VKKKQYPIQYTGTSDKSEILEFLKSNRRFVVHRRDYKGLTESQKLLKLIYDSGLYKVIDSKLLADFSPVKLEEYLLGPIICTECGSTINKYTLFVGNFNRTRRGLCNKKCDSLAKSKRMIGSNNVYHKLSVNDKLKLHKKQSIGIKAAIQSGKFTPAVTNSWANSRILLNINGELKKFRSSWEAYFQLVNQSALYEKLRIPYIYNNISRNYIVDFIDIQNKILYEIKPESLKTSEMNLVKEEAAIRWAKSNGYEYRIISDDWFFKNYNESLLIGQPDEAKMKISLRQFNVK
jgi:hypothetical protein